MYSVCIKVNGITYSFALDRGLDIVELIKGTKGEIQGLFIQGGAE